MKITRKQLRKVIKESLTEYGIGREYDHLRSGGVQADDLSGWEDLSDVMVTINQLISYEGEVLLDAAFGPGSSKPMLAEFDADAIYSDGKETLKALGMLMPDQSPDVLKSALKQWAESHTQYGLRKESYDEFHSKSRAHFGL